MLESYYFRMRGAKTTLILVFLLASLFAGQLQLVSPGQNATVSGEGVSLSFVATGDFSSSFSCTIKINGLSFEGIEALNGTETTTELVPLQPETDYLWNATCVGTGETLESETWNFTVHSAAAPPTAANFGVSYGTTNFSAAADLGNVANLTLAALYGKIKFAIIWTGQKIIFSPPVIKSPIKMNIPYLAMESNL